METSQSTGSQSVPSDVRILSVEEYREWVHDRVARGIFVKLGTILGVIGFGGFLALLALGKGAIDMQVAAKGTDIKNNITNDFRSLENEMSKTIEGAVEREVARTLLNLVDIQAQIRHMAETAVADEMKESGSLLNLLVRRLRPIAPGHQPALASQRNQALQLMTVFAMGQPQLRNDLLSILRSTDRQEDEVRTIALKFYEPANVIAEDAGAITVVLDQLQHVQSNRCAFA
jgi:hypothetical protein